MRRSVGIFTSDTLCAACIAGPCSCSASAGEKPKRSMWSSLYQDCIKSPYVWLFAIAYFFVYVVRQGVTSWFIFYLQVRFISGWYLVKCIALIYAAMCHHSSMPCQRH